MIAGVELSTTENSLQRIKNRKERKEKKKRVNSVVNIKERQGLLGRISAPCPVRSECTISGMGPYFSLSKAALAIPVFGARSLNYASGFHLGLFALIAQDNTPYIALC